MQKRDLPCRLLLVQFFTKGSSFVVFSADCLADSLKGNSFLLILIYEHLSVLLNNNLAPSFLKVIDKSLQMQCEICFSRVFQFFLNKKHALKLK